MKTQTKSRRIIAMLVALMLMLGMLSGLPGSLTVFAAHGDFYITGSSGFTYSSGLLTIKGSGTYTIGMSTTGATTYDNRIVVQNGVTATIKLNNVSIDVSGSGGACAFEITGNSTVNLIPTGTNFFKSGSNRAGIEVNSGNTLSISAADTNQTLEAVGSSSGGAGIGGAAWNSGGKITISGGMVTAKGNDASAGIGGGYEGDGGIITIDGGIVTATGNGGAGIGGGFYGGKGGKITINGGIVTATGNGGGAGIGGGSASNSNGGDNGSGGTITINGGMVTANGFSSGAGIGGGNKGDGGTINISGGIVTASSNVIGAAGIGGGGGTSIFNGGGSGGTINISGGTVTAYSIGPSYYGAYGTITITGGSVNALNGAKPQPTNGTDPVYLNTLTVGNPAIGNDVAIQAIGNDTNKSYGSKDVVTKNGGKVYIWLPQNSSDSTCADVITGDKLYSKTYTRSTSALSATLKCGTDITLTSSENKNFGSAAVGYTSPPAAQSVTITNTGNQTVDDLAVSLSGGSASSFTISSSTSASLIPSGTTSFSVQPKSGLSDGNYTETVSVSGDNVTTQTFEVTFTVVTDTTAPVIVTAPQNVTVDLNNSAQLSVTATTTDAGSPSFQWYSSSDNTTWTAVSGATNETYIPSTSKAGVTYYYVEVTNTNTSATGAQTASVDSSSASVTVNQKELTLNVTIADKVYDGLNTATIQSVDLVGVEGSDSVTLTNNGTAVFDSVSVGINIPVCFTSNFSIGGSDAGNYTLAQPTGVTGSITNGFIPVKGTHYTLSIPDGLDGWNKMDGFTIAAKSGYKISLGNADNSDWQSSLTYSAETADGSVTFYIRNTATNEISVVKTEGYKIDKTAPGGEIEIKNNSFKSFVNTITFGLFFKNKVDVNITGTDETSGIAAIDYIKTDAEIDSAMLENAAWLSYDSLSVQANESFIVYARITDNAGNFTIINSDGVVIYTDSAAVTTEITHVKLSGDKKATVTLNDNTIREIKSNTNYTLVKGTDYTISENEITFAAAYLDNLATGTHTLNVSYNPMGEGYVVGGDNEEPATTAIILYVSLVGQNLTLNGAGDSYTYGTNPITVSLSGKTNPAAEAYEIIPVEGTNVASVSGSTVTILKAGKFKIKATVPGNDTYDEASVTSGEITVSEAAPVVTLTGDNVDYGQNVTLNVTVTGSGATPAGTVTFKKDGVALESKALVNGTESFTDTVPDAGSYIYSVEYSGQTEYYASGSDSRTIGIGKTNQTDFAIASPGNKTYGDSNFTLEATGGQSAGTIIFSAPANNGVIDITPGGVVTIMNAGTVTVKAVRSGGDNYNDVEDTLELTIAQRDISNVEIKITGSTLYTGVQLMPGFTVKDGIIAIDTGDYSNAYDENINAGIEAGSVTITGQRNYTGIKTVKFDIQKADQTALTVVDGNITKTYGDGKFTPVLSGGSDGAGEVTWSSSHPAIVDVNSSTGEVTIKAATNDTTVILTAAKAGGNNYENTSAAVTVRVYKKELTVTADDKFRDYGVENPAFTVSYSGFVNGENENALTTQPGASCTADATTPVGIVPITVSGGVSDNYSFDYKAGSLSITAAGQTPIAITQGASLTKTYGDKSFKLTTTGGSGNGAIKWSSDNANLVSVDNIGNVTINGATGMPVTLTVTKAADGNYVTSEASIQITVNKKTLDVYVADEQRYYGEVNPAFTITYNGFVNGENENALTTKPAASCTATTNTEVGSYPIILSGGVSNNYEFYYYNGTLIINKSGDTAFKLNDGADVRKTYGDGKFMLETSGAYGAVTYESKNEAVATINASGEVTVIGAGEVQIYAYDAGDSNHESAAAAITLKVDKKAITVTADNKTKYFGDADPALTYTVNPALVSGDSLTGSLKYTGTDIGMYDIVEAAAFSNPNYKISFVSGTMTIKRTLTMDEVIENINALPNPINNWDDADKVADVTNNYEQLTDDEKNQIPDDVKEKLEKAQEQAGEINIKNGGIALTSSDLPWNIRVVATPIPESDSRYSAFFGKLTDKKLITLYDIKLINTLTGEEYVLTKDKTVTVEIDGANLNGMDSIAIAHEKEDGTIEFITATIKNGKVTFTASSFSLYGITAAADKKSAPTDPDIPGTGDNSNPIFWLLLGGAALTILRGMAVHGRKQKRNRLVKR